MDAAVSLIKADPTMGESEEGVIPAHTDVLPGLKFGAPLADNDRAGGDGFATEAFHSQPLTAAIVSPGLGSRFKRSKLANNQGTRHGP